MSLVTAHVLDAARGIPAAGVTVRLARADAAVIAESTTNEDGRVPELGPDRLEQGTYEITFGSGEYFATQAVPCFHPSITVLFTITEDVGHYHIPLLLSPYSYTTYRGS